MDFEAATIKIAQAADAWGPYVFNFPASSSMAASDGKLPFGSTIASATVTAYVGPVKHGVLLSSYTELAGLLDPEHVPAVVGNAVHVFFQHPGESYINQIASLVFSLTLSTGAINSFIFNSIVIA